MAGSSWSTFVKTALIPMVIALSMYVLIFLVLLPLYRRYRSHLARYTYYTPLSSNLAQQTTSLFEPYLIEPSKTLLQKLRESFIRGLKWAVVPSSWAWETGNVRGSRRPTHAGTNADHDEEDDDDEGGLFDVESGESMVGFDVQRAQDMRRGRPMRRENEEDDVVMDNSNRRLSRELEEGFRDDSAGEDSDEEVTAGRRTVSRRREEGFRP